MENLYSTTSLRSNFGGGTLRLKRIKIIGFKSFADKVVVDFHEGITGIVGPNGCGKSNISDSFRWVLGETSAKSLRGKKMEDIIFAGTTHRKQLNFAEVSITLTDIDGALAVDYEEVEITRRYHRNGESEFFINKHPVRMKDIQSLLLDTGIGKSAFSIFEQGKIDQVIQFSPIERRFIFEEAAGILRFLQRKREAMRKLEQTDGNISRVKDIHKEVEKQIVVLERQAEEARIFKEMKARYESLEKGLFVAKWDSLKDKMTQLLDKSGEKTGAIADSNNKLEQLSLELKQAKENLAEADRTLRQRSEAVYQARSDKEIKSRERESNVERIKETSVKEKRWRRELEEIIEKGKRRETDVGDANSRISLLKRQKEESENSYNAQKKKVEALEAEVVALREKQQHLHQDRLQHLREESSSESDLKQHRLRFEGSEKRLEEILERKRQIGVQLEEVLPQAKAKKEEVVKLSKAVDERKRELTGLEEEQESLSEEIIASQKIFDSIQYEQTECRARHAALSRLRDDNEGFSRGSKELLKEASTSKSVLYGKLKKLYEYVSGDKGSEKAISVILKPYAETLVVESEENFFTVLSYAKEKKIKDFSLICLEHLGKENVSPPTTIEGVAAFLNAAEKSILERHLFKETFLADTLEKALALSQKHPNAEAWTKSGEYLDRNRVLVFAAQSENNVFMREAELKNLDAKLKELEGKKSELEVEITRLHEKKSVIQTKRVELDKMIRRNEMTLVENNFIFQRFNSEIDRFQKESSAIDAELKILEAAICELNTGIKELEKKHALAQEKALLIHRQTDGLISELALKESNLGKEKELLGSFQSAYRQVCDDLLKVEHDIHIMKVQEQESEDQVRRLKEEIESSRELQAQFAAKSSEYEQLLGDVEERLAMVLSSCSELENEVQKCRENIEAIEEKMFKENEKIKKLEGEEHKIGLQQAQAESVLSAIEAELDERYHMSLDDVRGMSITLDRSIEESEKEVRTLRKDLEQAQSEVNMTSIEEYDKNKTRYEFLNKEIGDLDGSKSELLAIITKLDGESRTLFKETFEKVRENFQKNFKILFNGGEADLQFTEDGDVLEAGIEIVAKPPGKKMRSINLLSGGEKCMTAVALLFAVFEVKPAPFCILDEIDAPLDDSNVERFVNVVKQFIDRSQFIIITHNKRTMSICDRLFGVSMQERGVSKLLKMEFDSHDHGSPEVIEEYVEV